MVEIMIHLEKVATIGGGGGVKVSSTSKTIKPEKLKLFVKCRFEFIQIIIPGEKVGNNGELFHI